VGEGAASATDSEGSRLAPIRLRTALVHDWFQGYHGSERVVETIRSGLFDRNRQPHVFTFYAARSLLPAELGRAIVQESRLTKIPGLAQDGPGAGRWRYLLPAIPFYFRTLDLDGYELVISSSHTFAMHVRAPEGVPHVCYCHTPVRYAWMPSETGDQRRGLPGVGLRAARSWFQVLDRRASRGPTSFVANSTAVQERIRRFYGREATVIHPPVDVDDFTPRRAETRSFLWVHRLVPHKRPEVVVEAFRGLPYRLTMVGVGMLERSLRRDLPPNVDLLPWLPRRELVALFERSAGFVHVGEEDFGISMVEALAAGTPVIALHRGGARDIVREGVDGLLVESPDVRALRAAVVECASRDWDAHALARRAQEFSREHFLARLRTHLTELGVA
jgi:glycosyltransferase involved in cell wall biosynthesis